MTDAGIGNTKGNGAEAPAPQTARARSAGRPSLHPSNQRDFHSYPIAGENGNEGAGLGFGIFRTTDTF